MNLNYLLDLSHLAFLVIIYGYWSARNIYNLTSDMIDARRQLITRLGLSILFFSITVYCLEIIGIVSIVTGCVIFATKQGITEMKNKTISTTASVIVVMFLIFSSTAGQAQNRIRLFDDRDGNRISQQQLTLLETGMSRLYEPDKASLGFYRDSTYKEYKAKHNKERKPLKESFPFNNATGECYIIGSFQAQDKCTVVFEDGRPKTFKLWGKKYRVYCVKEQNYFMSRVLVKKKGIYLDFDVHFPEKTT